MILIADSGSTKTDWSVIENNQLVQSLRTKGMNPYFQPENEIDDELSNILLPQLCGKDVESVYFYGAGCTAEKIDLMQNKIEKRLSAQHVEVNSDLLGAARSLCGRESGIAGILGTGSNSCFYDGEKIVKNVPALGFVLGNEGAGDTLGRHFVSDLLKDMINDEIKELFLNKYDLTAGKIIERVYKQPFPNRFLAGFAPFIEEHLDIPEVQKIVIDNFCDFFNRNIKHYDYRRYRTNLVGSIAFHFRGLLMVAAKQCGIHLGRIIQSPMEGLIDYHTCQTSNE
jgi:N-acetylglucosamine kinase-like BadF-type ATPase